MTCKDRLAELRRLSSKAGVHTELCVDVAAGDNPCDDDEETVALAAPSTCSPQHEQYIQDIFNEVEQIRRWIADVRSNTSRVRRLHSDPTYHTNKLLQEQLDALVTASNGTGLKVCGALRQLEARCGAAAASGVHLRIARLQYAATHRLYGDALADHQHALDLLRDYQLRLLQDQIKLTNLSVTEEECERLLDSNNVSLFVDNVEADTAAARIALRDAEMRREELVRVEAALRNVRDLFQQLAHLVALQQDQVDSVEFYALRASEHVELGGQELLKGTVIKRKTRKKKLGLILCLTSGFVIVLLVLVYT